MRFSDISFGLTSFWRIRERLRAQRHGVEDPEALNDENDREDVAHLWRE